MKRPVGEMKPYGLYDPKNEHDSCGIGFVVNIDGRKENGIVQKGLIVLKNLVHRGALGGDLKTGDGAGISIQIPHEFFHALAKEQNIDIGEEGSYGVGMIFLSQNEKKANRGLEILQETTKEVGSQWLGTRDVPTCPDCLGDIALRGLPKIVQVFIKHDDLRAEDLERKLYLIRKMSESRIKREGFKHEDVYIPSFSCKTIVYKGLFTAEQIEKFYPDLVDTRLKSAIALVHQRYSTNTFPSWSLAHPFRYLAHNGEINTLRGNINKMKAREYTMSSDLFKDDLLKLYPIIDTENSDSGVFDNMFEFLVNAGRGIEHAITMMVPESFGTEYHMSKDKRAFYEYHSTFMEPWDGPAALVFTDGTKVGATLDRNGLRPCRYTITKDGFVVLASETGVLDIEPENVLKKGRLEPGKIFFVDTNQKRIIDDIEVKANISRRKPYRRWLDANKIEIKSLFSDSRLVETDEETILQRQLMFGYTNEDIDMIIQPMAADGQEPVNSMGRDFPLAVLSKQPKLLFEYFKQLFAQVTNPPIDHIREGLVMSLMAFVGREGNLLDETPEHCKRLKLKHPILTNQDLTTIRNSNKESLKSVVIPALFKVADGHKGLEDALDQLFGTASIEIKNGTSFIILSDRDADEENAPIPILLAASGLHHHLIRTGQRSLAGIFVETGEAREVMHFALLIGYGVNAINPYLALETITHMKNKGKIPSSVDEEVVVDNYIKSINKGLLKVFSKLGISTLRSYNGAQNFEAVGLSQKLVDKYFSGTVSRIDGITLKEIAAETLARHTQAFDQRRWTNTLNIGGQHRVRVNNEEHQWNPFSIKTLQRAVINNDYSLFKEFSNYFDLQEERIYSLRGLFRFKEGSPIAIDQVEPESEIVKRFVTGAMSYGSMGLEAHQTLAAAMNKLGGKSNSGEGGEDPRRYVKGPNGRDLSSATKQVASARFGVTTEYLINAKELQIKIAQGAKPGEGGQLPGHKVDEAIAKVRYTTPGVTLISPPPHHDIYSIEDIAQLIWDLHNVNTKARVSVKLVAEVGVGTVAAGVAKGKSDMVLISGNDGGTGASPMSSIHHAGIPWELGLAETQQTLVNNQLRDKIRVQVDGKLKTGRDVVIAALLGAEEFGFSTIALIAMGCIMMRKCHLNTCPVGINTQREDLREKFSGKPEDVERFFFFLAKEMREIMAELGFRKVEDMVGRVDMLDIKKDIDHEKAKTLDFSKLLASDWTEGVPLRCTNGQSHDYSKILDKKLIEECKPAIEDKEKVNLDINIRNSARAVGAMLSGKIAEKHGYDGLKEDTITVNFTGSAGQSFGAFLSHGVTFNLEGDANDYMGKGLSGGKIIVVPPKRSTFVPHENIIVGNTLLYGATGGEIYIQGVTGERFCVRNSGVEAVVEGVGDHGCEYMTGGIVVVLGKTGRNFAAGMSGGMAFVLDSDHLFDTLCNLDMVDIEQIDDPTDEKLLKDMIEKHVGYTGSERAKDMLRNWDEIFPQFVKVMPMEYKRVLQSRQKEAEASASATVTEADKEPSLEGSDVLRKEEVAIKGG